MPHSYQDLASKLQAVIDTAIDGIILIDAKGRIEEINKSALDLFGYQKIELLGKNVSSLMPSPDRERHDSYIHNYQTTRVPKIIGIGREVQGKKKDGLLFYFRLAVSEVILNNRVVYTGIVHDLTAIKNAELAQQQLTQDLEQRVVDRTDELEKVVNRLLQSNQLLEKEITERKSVEVKLIDQEQMLKTALQNEIELNELKTRFLSMASHEFRTPLSTILSSASILTLYEGHPDGTKRERHIERIKSAVSNLTAILNDFLSLGRLEEGKVDINLSAVSVFELCEQAISELEGMLQPNQNILIEEVGDRFALLTDSRIVKNILFNLTSNAIKYSVEGQSIRCVITYKKEEAQIDIIDKGIGIAANEQKHLSERFFRASNADTIQGTGLGLNIVKKYLDLIDGSLSFKSELKVGSTFTIHIPNLTE